nr:hypothetical protein [Propionicimonas sp.]
MRQQDRSQGRRFGHASLAVLLAAWSLCVAPVQAHAEARVPGDATVPGLTTSTVTALHRPDVAAMAKGARTASTQAAGASVTGAIAGRVTGPNARPLAGAHVGAWSPTANEWTQYATTGADGSYVLSGLAAASYVLCFLGPDSGSLASECWENEPFLETADAIRVWPARTVSGRNAQLEPAGRVSGNVTLAGQPMAQANVSVYLNHRGWRYVGSVATDGNGGFDATGLFPGTYGLAIDHCCATIEARGDDSVGLAWGDRKGRAVASVRPTVSGAAVVGGLLKARPGSGRFAKLKLALSYQWLRDGVEVPNAIGATYRVTSEDVGARLSVLATSTRAGDGSSLAGVSRATQRVAVASVPTIEGVAQVGGTVSAVPGDWTAGTTFAYQWYAEKRAIKGATGADYVPTPATAGKRLSVRVTGSLAGHPTLVRTSAPTTRVMRWSAPVVSGSLVVDVRLSVARGTWSPRTSFSYQWLRHGVPIPAATGSSYRLTAEDLGTRVTVRVTGKRSGYATVVSESAPGGLVSATDAPQITEVVAASVPPTAPVG